MVYLSLLRHVHRLGWKNLNNIVRRPHRLWCPDGWSWVYWPFGKVRRFISPLANAVQATAIHAARKTVYTPLHVISVKDRVLTIPKNFCSKWLRIRLQWCWWQFYDVGDRIGHQHLKVIANINCHQRRRSREIQLKDDFPDFAWDISSCWTADCKSKPPLEISSFISYFFEPQQPILKKTKTPGSSWTNLFFILF